MQNTRLGFEDVFMRVKSAIRLSTVTVTINLVMVLALIIFNPVLNRHQLIETVAALVIWLATIAFLNFYVDRTKTTASIQNIYFAVMIENILLLNWIVYNVGGGEWLGAIFYLFPVVYGNIIFSQTNGFLISTMAGLNYALLLLLECFDIIPFREFFTLGVDLHHNTQYVFVVISFMFFTFYSIGLTVNILTNLLRKRTATLEKTRLELEEIRYGLEMKVIARTKELKELAKGLEGQVEERTKELKGRVNELERFQRLTVGRELKMLELKKEIQILKDQLNKKE